MIDTKEEEDFFKYLENLNSKYQQLEPGFLQYFCNFYGKEERYRKWALAFRNTEHRRVDTNNFVESFHNKLKSYYFSRVQNRRIDILLNTILQVEQDAYGDRLLRQMRNQPSIEVQHINDRHTSSMLIFETAVVQHSETHFSVRSATSVNVYDIYVLNDNCDLKQCYVKCTATECGRLCFHMYKCSCPDFNEHCNICKHIHRVHQSTKPQLAYRRTQMNIPRISKWPQKEMLK